MCPQFNEVLIIDSSHTPLQLKNLVQKNRIFVHQSEPGLSKARNLGLNLVSQESNFIHFVDDDVSLSRDYLLNVNVFFSNYPGVSAVTGIDLNLNEKSSFKLSLLKICVNVFKLNGKISNLGFNFGNYSMRGTYRVDWMPGCNMIIKRDLSNCYQFVENNAPLFFEDVIFGLDVSENSLIYFSDSIQYRHHLSPTNRLGKIHKKKSLITNQSYLLDNYGKRFNLIFIKTRIRLVKIYLGFFNFYAFLSRTSVQSYFDPK